MPRIAQIIVILEFLQYFVFLYDVIPIVLQLYISGIYIRAEQQFQLFYYMLQHKNSNHSNIQKQSIDSISKLLLLEEQLKKHSQFPKMQQKLLFFRIPIQTFASGKKKINLTMILKLIKWMAKVNRETLQFSAHTFQNAIKILFAYLQKVDESPKELQLIGSVSFHLASKVTEKQIIAIQSYRQMCKEIFTKESFQVKQKVIFTSLDHSIDFLTMDKIINFFKISLEVPDLEVKALRENCESFLLDERFWNYNDYEVLLTFLSMLQTMKKEPTTQQLLKCLGIDSKRQK